MLPLAEIQALRLALDACGLLCPAQQVVHQVLTPGKAKSHRHVPGAEHHGPGVAMCVAKIIGRSVNAVKRVLEWEPNANALLDAFDLLQVLLVTWSERSREILPSRLPDKDPEIQSLLTWIQSCSSRPNEIFWSEKVNLIRGKQAQTAAPTQVSALCPEAISCDTLQMGMIRQLGRAFFPVFAQG